MRVRDNPFLVMALAIAAVIDGTILVTFLMMLWHGALW
jgi:hypothetical protein